MLEKMRQRTILLLEAMGVGLLLTFGVGLTFDCAADTIGSTAGLGNSSDGTVYGSGVTICREGDQDSLLNEGFYANLQNLALILAHVGRLGVNSDYLYGGPGEEFLAGYGGSDRLDGGGGSDTVHAWVFDRPNPPGFSSWVADTTMPSRRETECMKPSTAAGAARRQTATRRDATW